jgi:signal transduction histidine kinase
LDITEQKKAEQELAALNKQLLDTSRQAGMAEVATGVLHNVGNVLNSVNVAATIVADKVRTSKTSSVAKVSALLGAHAADLGAFITTDAKGKQLPGFLVTLAEHLANEKSFLLRELDSLRNNIDHIKEIVAMQQSYAKVSGTLEILPVASLVEDALRMHAAALARHNVQVVREFSDVPLVCVDKHKVLQILVNLIRNAKYALDERGHVEKRLTLRIGMTGSDCAQVVVSDNGIGIPQESLTRIFSHGFSTRKDGHGFGLHSGALAAKAMGGSLMAHSDGPHQGATFTLELPINSEQVHSKAA